MSYYIFEVDQEKKYSQKNNIQNFKEGKNVCKAILPY